MKPVKTTTSEFEDFLQKTFTVEMTGLDLFHIAALSFQKEGGTEFPVDGRLRDRIRNDVVVPLGYGRFFTSEYLRSGKANVAELRRTYG